MDPSEFYTTDQLVWRFSMPAEDVPDDVPEQWTAAFSAVARDLRYRRYGRSISFAHVGWELRVSGDFSVEIGIVGGAGADIGGCLVGQGFMLDASVAQATVWVASTVQDDLSGYEFVQWPSDGWRLLSPGLRDGVAVWVDSSTTEVVAEIGTLSEG